MNGDMLALVILFLLIAATVGAIVSLSALIGRVRAPKERLISYECGLDPAVSTRRPFPIKFFLIAVLFIIFDVEVVLLFPWAIAFNKAIAAGEGTVLLVELIIFLALLGLALVFALGKGALKWEE
ncbi:MAG: NADH-quinone oxidoreductase subunit A [Pseudomonadota bacterium]